MSPHKPITTLAASLREKIPGAKLEQKQDRELIHFEGCSDKYFEITTNDNDNGLSYEYFEVGYHAVLGGGIEVDTRLVLSGKAEQLIPVMLYIHNKESRS